VDSQDMKEKPAKALGGSINIKCCAQRAVVGASTFGRYTNYVKISSKRKRKKRNQLR
jgi:hypothetical protein